MREWVAVLAVALASAGCVQSGPSSPGHGPGTALAPSLIVSPPHQVNGAEHAYEPSIALDSAETIYVTAHKVVGPATQAASWLWYSKDDGATWAAMPSPAGVQTLFPALEGDIAVDQTDQVHFVDTYAQDQTISVWQGGEGGPVWQRTQLFQGTVPKDDRPWISAHGDGIVYYIGNDADVGNGVDPDPEDLGRRGWAWFSASEDGGLTWRPAETIPYSFWFCGLAASRADDVTVWRGCSLRAGDEVIVLERSSDRGRAWSEMVRTPRNATATPFMSTATDQQGQAFHTWIEDDGTDDQPGRIRIFHPAADGAGYAVADLPIGNRSVSKQWVDAWGQGRVGIAYYATDDVPTTPDSRWHVYARFGQAGPGGLSWGPEALLDPEPVAVGTFAPQDFFECAFGPDGRLHVVYGRRVANPPATIGEVDDIFHVGVALAQP